MYFVQNNQTVNNLKNNSLKSLSLNWFWTFIFPSVWKFIFPNHSKLYLSSQWVGKFICSSNNAGCHLSFSLKLDLPKTVCLPAQNCLPAFKWNTMGFRTHNFHFAFFVCSFLVCLSLCLSVYQSVCGNTYFSQTLIPQRSFWNGNHAIPLQRGLVFTKIIKP